MWRDPSSKMLHGHWETRIGRIWAALCLFVIAPAASAAVAEEPRPSFLMIVVDTLRKDAVSAYGAVSNTTPAMDALAADGLRFNQAFASAPWTVPSHATIFTGRRVDEHGVSLPGRSVLGTNWPTIAESFNRRGFETAAFTENSLVSDVFQLLRGFEVKKVSRVDSEGNETAIDALSEISAWLAKRDARKPFFAFVNLFDAHAPYEVREENPWIPNVPRSDLQTRSDRPHLQICGALPTPSQIAIQRGLYLGDVHEADRKLGQIVAAAEGASAGRQLIVVVVSDHGELFGEWQLMTHEFSLHASLLNVPLIVHGLPGVAPAIIDAPVGLEDLMPSLLQWSGDSVPDGLPGQFLPTTAAPLDTSIPKANPRSLFAAYSDKDRPMPEAWKDRAARADKEHTRQFCTDHNPVFGDMTSLVRYPFHYLWYERYPARLYDLSWDSKEMSDVSRHHPDLVNSLQNEIDAHLQDGTLVGSPEPTEMSQDVIDALRALGYAE